MSIDYLSHRPEWFQLPRFLPVEGAYNIRDLGGYPTRGGMFVKWGKVYRSGDLDKLTRRDIQLLTRKDIKTVIDFRSPVELAQAPSCPIPSVVNVMHLPIDPGNAIELKKTATEISGLLMEQIYELLVREFQPTYARFFELLMNRQVSPLLFHCTGGKDRTGFAAALFLSALGVDRDIIMEDYMMSAAPSEEKYAREIKERPAMLPLLTVHPDYLKAAFRVIDGEYDGIDAYLTSRLHADLSLLRDMYTSPVFPKREESPEPPQFLS